MLPHFACLMRVSLSCGQSSGTKRTMSMRLLMTQTSCIQLSLDFFFPYTVIYSNIYVVSFTINITYLQNDLCFSLLKWPFEFQALLLPFHMWQTDIWNITAFYLIKMSALSPRKHVWSESHGMMWKYQLATQPWYLVTSWTHPSHFYAHMAVIFQGMDLDTLLHFIYIHPERPPQRVLKVLSHTKSSDKWLRRVFKINSHTFLWGAEDHKIN